jgi:hypothetical protein
MVMTKYKGDSVTKDEETDRVKAERETNGDFMQGELGCGNREWRRQAWRSWRGAGCEDDLPAKAR